MTLAAGDVVDLQRIAVPPDRRRRGSAGAARRGCWPRRRDRRTPDAARGARPTTAALAFYAAAGFVEIGRRRGYYRDGTDAW